MKTLILTFILALCVSSAFSQNAQLYSQPIDFSRIPPQSSFLARYPYIPPVYYPVEYYALVEKAIDKKEKFASEQFFNAYMVFATGKRTPTIKMNYNRFLGKMELINEEGDTLIVTDASALKYVVTEKNTYYYHSSKGYFEVVAGKNKSVKLVLQDNLKLVNRYAPEHPTPNKSFYSTSVKMKDNEGRLREEKLLFSKRKHYYLLTENDQVFKANISGFIKAFPQHEERIKRYIRYQAREHTPIRFKREIDIKRLLDHCLQLN